jgi:hypothetical protein
MNFLKPSFICWLPSLPAGPLICDHLANEVLHPDGKRGQAGPQIVADRWSMSRVREDFAEMVDNSALLRRLRQHILEPMERLNHSHCGTPRPKQPTGCGRFELDYLIAQTNRFEACCQSRLRCVRVQPS